MDRKELLQIAKNLVIFEKVDSWIISFISFILNK
jgi:hypothetical protein